MKHQKLTPCHVARADWMPNINQRFLAESSAFRGRKSS